MAIACDYGRAEERRTLPRPKESPGGHRAGVGNDRAAQSNCCAGAQPNSSPVLPSFRSVALNLAVARVAGMAPKPDDRPAGNGLALAPSRLVLALEISVTWSLARCASKGLSEVSHLIARDGP
jgi:hypothetical protein